MKKYILWTFLSLLPLWSNETQDKILVMKPIPSSLLAQIAFNECEGCSNEELLVVLATIKNRIEHEDFPSTLESVLLQPNQFSTIKKIVPIEFTNKIDSLWKLPIKYHYLYFRSGGYSYSRWMKYKNFHKVNNSIHEFAK